MGNKTLLEEIQQKPMVIKGDHPPYAIRTWLDTFYDYVTEKQYLSNLPLYSDQWGRSVSSAQPQPSATNSQHNSISLLWKSS